MFNSKFMRYIFKFHSIGLFKKIWHEHRWILFFITISIAIVFSVILYSITTKQSRLLEEYILVKNSKILKINIIKFSSDNGENLCLSIISKNEINKFQKNGKHVFKERFPKPVGLKNEFILSIILENGMNYRYWSVIYDDYPDSLYIHKNIPKKTNGGYYQKGTVPILVKGLSYYLLKILREHGCQ